MQKLNQWSGEDGSENYSERIIIEGTTSCKRHIDYADLRGIKQPVVKSPTSGYMRKDSAYWSSYLLILWH